MQNWNFLNNLEVHLVIAKLAIAFGLEVSEGFASFVLTFQVLLYFRLAI